MISSAFGSCRAVGKIMNNTCAHTHHHLVLTGARGHQPQQAAVPAAHVAGRLSHPAQMHERVEGCAFWQRAEADHPAACHQPHQGAFMFPLCCTHLHSACCTPNAVLHGCLLLSAAPLCTKHTHTQTHAMLLSLTVQRGCLSRAFYAWKDRFHIVDKNLAMRRKVGVLSDC